MDWLHGRLGTVVLWALLIILESGGQIATKVGGDQLGQMDFTLQWLLNVAQAPGVLLAIACYIGAFFVWMLILRRSSLSLAFPLSSLVFVGVLLGSWLGLGEQISERGQTRRTQQGADDRQLVDGARPDAPAARRPPQHQPDGQHQRRDERRWQDEQFQRMLADPEHHLREER